MPNVMRYRGGDCQPQPFKTNPNYPIQEGDLLFMDPTDGTARPATALKNQGDKATNQDYFQQYFAGVALGRSGLQPGEWTPTRTTDIGYVLVATGGDFEFDCPTQQFKPGDLVGVFADAKGCQSQQVDTAASASLAIGTAVPGVQSLQNPASRIVVRIKSTIATGGVQNQVAGAGSGQEENQPPAVGTSST